MSGTPSPDSAALGRADLERRYRRLLACYPTSYRAEYGEEMMGVLLASTPADQSRPTKAAAFDLIGGGLRAWLRLLRSGDGDSPWRDTLAVFSVIAPVLVFLQVAGGYLVTVVPVDRFGGFASAGFDTRLEDLLIASAVGLAAVIICPLLARRGGTSAMVARVIAVIAVALAIAAVILSLVAYANDSYYGFIASTLVVEIVALLASPGPRRGWELLGRRGLVALAGTAVLLASAAAFHYAGLAQTGHNSFDWWNIGNTVDAVGPVVGVALMAVTLGWRAGGRLFAVWAIPLYPFVGYDAVSGCTRTTRRRISCKSSLSSCPPWPSPR